jgi:hypothetical protein
VIQRSSGAPKGGSYTAGAGSRCCRSDRFLELRRRVCCPCRARTTAAARRCPGARTPARGDETLPRHDRISIARIPSVSFVPLKTTNDTAAADNVRDQNGSARMITGGVGGTGEQQPRGSSSTIPATTPSNCASVSGVGCAKAVASRRRRERRSLITSPPMGVWLVKPPNEASRQRGARSAPSSLPSPPENAPQNRRLTLIGHPPLWSVAADDHRYAAAEQPVLDRCARHKDELLIY